MNGSKRLSDEEKREMLKDAKDSERGKVFNSARILSQQVSLDEYIDFISESLAFVDFTPSVRITKNFKL